MFNPIHSRHRIIAIAVAAVMTAAAFVTAPGAFAASPAPARVNMTALLAGDAPAIYSEPAIAGANRYTA